MFNQTELDTDNKPIKFCSDEGSEFTNNYFQEYLNHNGIIRQPSVVATPQQNGFVEREMRTLGGMARTLLNAAQLPRKFWPEAIHTANYIRNRSLASNKDQTPFELWHGVKPNVRNLKIFGQHAIIRKHRDITKLDERGEKVIFLGYTAIHNTFRFYNPATDKIIVSCNARFLNSFGPIAESSDDILSDSTEKRISVLLPIQQVYQNVPVQVSDQPTTSTPRVKFRLQPGLQIPGISRLFNPNNQQEQTVQENSNYVTSNDLEDTPQQEDLSQDESQPQEDNSPDEQVEQTVEQAEGEHDAGYNLRPRGVSKLISRVAKHIANPAIGQENDDPQTFDQAMKRPDAEEWLAAMTDEFASLRRCNVWELTDRPNQNVVSCRWVLKTKRSHDNEIVRYRARLVARGFTQEKGKDYFQTYAPVCDTSAIRLLFAYAAARQLIIKQFDVKAAFLYGDLNELVYVEQPPGFNSDKSKVYKLNKALYGLKQASKQWSVRFTEFLTKLNLKQLNNDNCIFIQGSPQLILAIYVDDAIILAQDN